ncbi:uncharacterized protein LOC119377379 [Rhipicephalus sanguineus]|uniref:Uncharacterized protein n=1 Tax=Rhipicephalus sanguineus TaxID=34632 RepID=A0A9D4P949_RHISA|nr:uncharacterized protein LOC119377379 [Rhipicephalus sanguineus]KAH7932032.1 hypothetical protein HPB52_024982 [Rhipicephalus sanguineus]
MAPERRVPIQKSDLSILDNEFSSIRERFEAEMRKMEEEMSRFRSQLMDHERDFFAKSNAPLQVGPGAPGGPPGAVQPAAAVSGAWLLARLAVFFLLLLPHNLLRSLRK